MKTSELDLKTEFEDAFVELAQGLGFADSEKEHELVSRAVALLEAKAAVEVLAEPNGPVLYEDPVLSTAWEYARVLGFAAEGEDLKNTRLGRWIHAAACAVAARWRPTWDVLASFKPLSEPELPSPARIAVFGDAGYRGLPQQKLLSMILERHRDSPFHAAIHLGDTYYGGSEKEMLMHLVEPLSRLSHEIDNVYTLCGNHDLYGGPEGFSAAMRILDQPGRYFSLRSGDWVVACLDSSLGAQDAFYRRGELDADQADWLKNLESADSRLVLMSHHAPHSAWEEGSARLAKQTADLDISAWYWGHEHRSVAYTRSASRPFFGTCIGNGVFLERFTQPKDRESIEWFPEEGRCTCFSQAGKRWWPHGFVELELSKDGITETYHTEGTEPYERKLAIERS